MTYSCIWANNKRSFTLFSVKASFEAGILWLRPCDFSFLLTVRKLILGIHSCCSWTEVFLGVWPRILYYLLVFSWSRFSGAWASRDVAFLFISLYPSSNSRPVQSQTLADCRYGFATVMHTKDFSSPDKCAHLSWALFFHKHNL